MAERLKGNKERKNKQINGNEVVYTKSGHGQHRCLLKEWRIENERVNGI